MGILYWLAWYAYLSMASLCAMWTVILFAEAEGQPAWQIILRLAQFVLTAIGFVLLMSIAAQNPMPIRWTIRYWFAAAATAGWAYLFWYVYIQYRRWKQAQKWNDSRDSSAHPTT